MTDLHEPTLAEAVAQDFEEAEQQTETSLPGHVLGARDLRRSRLIFAFALFFLSAVVLAMTFIEPEKAVPQNTNSINDPYAI